MKISEKFRDILKEEDLTVLQENIDKVIAEQVDLKVAEQTKKIELSAEEKSKKTIEEQVATQKEAIIKEYDAKIEELEGTVVEKLDQFLDSEIQKNISESALEEVAVNETLKPIVEGVKKLFEENYVQLDTEGHKILKEAKEEIEKLEGQVSTEISDKMELKNENEKLKVKLLLTEKVNGLTKEQSDRVKSMFEGKDYEEVNTKIDSFLEIVLKENKVDEGKEEKNEKVNEDLATDADSTDSGKKVVKTFSITEKAGSLL